MSEGFRTIAGLFFRIGFSGEDVGILRGALSPDGRYHHDGQSALYGSPRADWAARAVEPDLQPDDPPRSVHRLMVNGARVVDTRDHEFWAALGIDPADSDVPASAARGGPTSRYLVGVRHGA